LREREKMVQGLHSGYRRKFGFGGIFFN
jgi:hypothetical protein